MSDIRKYIELIESYELLESVKIVNGLNNEPLKDDDTIRVYHGSTSHAMVYKALMYGISGDGVVDRTYSYENNNNPRGLFVTPDLDTAKEFGDYILEFHCKVGDLEAPVWPNGIFTVQGGKESFFSDDEERESERLRARKKWSESDIESVKNSDRPELAATLFVYGERQALFTGNLNGNSIRAVWVNNKPQQSNGTFVRYSRSDFIKSYNDRTLPRSHEIEDNTETYIMKPREIISGDEFIKRYMDMLGYDDTADDIEFIVEILKDTPDYIRNHTWNSNQFNRIWNDIKKM